MYLRVLRRIETVLTEREACLGLRSIRMKRFAKPVLLAMGVVETLQNS